jgi:hypothetical protein
MRKISMRDPRARRNTFVVLVLLVLLVIGAAALFTVVDWSAGAGVFLAGAALFGGAGASTPPLP